VAARFEGETLCTSMEDEKVQRFVTYENIGLKKEACILFEE